MSTESPHPPASLTAPVSASLLDVINCGVQRNWVPRGMIILNKGTPSPIHYSSMYRERRRKNTKLSSKRAAGFRNKA